MRTFIYFLITTHSQSCLFPILITNQIFIVHPLHLDNKTHVTFLWISGLVDVE